MSLVVTLPLFTVTNLNKEPDVENESSFQSKLAVNIPFQQVIALMRSLPC